MSAVLEAEDWDFVLPDRSKTGGCVRVKQCVWARRGGGPDVRGYIRNVNGAI